jgi:hypothetical protein
MMTESSSIIPGDPELYLSPDSLLVYAQYNSNIEIYGFQSSTGSLTVSTSLPVGANATIATATLQN